MGRQVITEGADATEFAANMIAKALPNLKGLSIGEPADVSHDENGELQFSWAWTEPGLENYALQQFPL